MTWFYSTRDISLEVCMEQSITWTQYGTYNHLNTVWYSESNTKNFKRDFLDKKFRKLGKSSNYPPTLPILDFLFSSCSPHAHAPADALNGTQRDSQSRVPSLRTSHLNKKKKKSIAQTTRNHPYTPYNSVPPTRLIYIVDYTYEIFTPVPYWNQYNNEKKKKSAKRLQSSQTTLLAHFFFSDISLGKIRTITGAHELTLALTLTLTLLRSLTSDHRSNPDVLLTRNHHSRIPKLGPVWWDSRNPS